MDDKSFAKLPTQRVIELCQQSIDSINEKRANSDAKRIKYYIANDIKWKNRWAKIFRFKPVPLTEEQADKDLRSSDTWFYPSEYAWGSLATAQKLLRLAKEAERSGITEVAITSEDYDYIS